MLIGEAFRENIHKHEKGVWGGVLVGGGLHLGRQLCMGVRGEVPGGRHSLLFPVVT